MLWYSWLDDRKGIWSVKHLALATTKVLLWGPGLSLSLCLHFNGHFPDGPGLAGTTRMSPFWIWLELRMMEMVVTAGAIWHANLKSIRHHQQTNTQLCYRPDAHPVAQPTVSEHWRELWGVLALQAAISGEIGQINEIWESSVSSSLYYNITYCMKYSVRDLAVVFCLVNALLLHTHSSLEHWQAADQRHWVCIYCLWYAAGV